VDLADRDLVEPLHRYGLSRMRTDAVVWRNGLGALLAGPVGFSLIKGRSDVSTLSDNPAATGPAPA
jgi:hypothetical protein